MGFLAAVDRSIAPLVRGLENRAKRHAAVASNVVNADTPGYRAIDVSFGAQLDRARLKLATTDPRHSKGAASASTSAVVVLSGGLPRRDGNDVNIDKEMTKLARNQIEYQFLARRLGGKFSKLKEAIKGQSSQ